MGTLAVLSTSWVERVEKQDSVVTWGDVVLEKLVAHARAQLRRGRWKRMVGDVLVVSDRPHTEDQLQIGAVLRAGPDAVLAGEAALVRGGLTGWDCARTDVLSPRYVTPWAGVRYHRTRGVPARCREDELWEPLPAAAIHAAEWASTDATAQTLIRMVLQRRLVTPDELEPLITRSTRRRKLVLAVLDDVRSGATTASEALFLKAWRAHSPALPELSLQHPFEDSQGCTRKVDALCLPERFPGMTLAAGLEIEGMGHLEVDTNADDLQRHNDAAARGIVLLHLSNAQVGREPARAVEALLATCRRLGWVG